MSQNATTTNKTTNGIIAGCHIASQMAQSTYHHSPLTKNARPKHKNPHTTKPNLLTPYAILEYKK